VPIYTNYAIIYGIINEHGLREGGARRCTCTPLALAYELSGEGTEKKFDKKIM